jgi:hypothetical protein
MNLGAIQHGTMNVEFFRFDGAGGKDDDTKPVIETVLVSVEIKHGFGEEPKIKRFVFLELKFREIDDSRGSVFWGDEDPIDPKGGLFDFNGLEAIVFSVFWLVL